MCVNHIRSTSVSSVGILHMIHPTHIWLLPKLHSPPPFFQKILELGVRRARDVMHKVLLLVGKSVKELHSCTIEMSQYTIPLID